MEMLATSPDAPLVERSLSGQRWKLRDADERMSQALARDLAIPQALARLLMARGIAPDDAYGFLNPNLKTSLPDPSHLMDMDAAAERIAGAIIAGETIAIFGDYDVDGATSSALLARYFASLGKPAIVYIPDRMKEGYGPNAPAMLRLKEQGASVIITVDCGTLAFDALDAAHDAGIDVIVIDHHLGEARKPKAFALVNPNRMDESSPHRQMAAVGVAFLAAVAVNRALRKAGYFTDKREPDLLSLLDIVALGTVCDVVALTGVNRALVTQGLKVMAGRGNIGIRTLLDVSRVDEKPGVYHSGFMLGPRVNAGGRVGQSGYGARLLATDDAQEALTLARALDGYNEERKAIEAFVLEDALSLASAQEDEPVLLIAGQGWHPGVIGIVAGRLKERYRKPVAVIALDGETGKASARSISGFDFGASVIAGVEAGLLAYGGGHAMAAGFTIEAAKIPAFQAFLCKRFAAQCRNQENAHTLSIDACVALSGANAELAQVLEQAGPFGAGNPQPRLMVENVTIANAAIAGGQHVRLTLTDESKRRLSAIAFRTADTPAGQQLLRMSGKRVHVAGSLRMNYWQGRESVSLFVDDVAAAA